MNLRFVLPVPSCRAKRNRTSARLSAVNALRRLRSVRRWFPRKERARPITHFADFRRCRMRLECPMPVQAYETITLGHGGGGKLTHRLLSQLLLPTLNNSYLSEMHDGAVVSVAKGRLAVTTDSFVISPPFFPGGDIGSLSVHGTANDLAMCGARPLFISLALILEEGFLIRELYEVIASIREACDALNIQVITGDMKVVERGKGDGIFINTTGIGEVL